MTTGINNRHHPTGYRQSGFILLGGLIAAALLMSAVMLVARIAMFRAQRASSQSHSLRAETVATQKLGDTFALPSPSRIVIENGLQVSEPLPELNFSRTAATVRAYALGGMADSSAIISYPRTESRIPLFRWSSVVRSSLPICENWQRTVFEIQEHKPRAVSTWSCLGLEQPVSSSSVVKGNLTTATQLVISPTVPDLVLTILGEAELSLIKIEHAINSRIEIVAAGDIKITEIDATTSSSSSLNITSIYGVAEVGRIADGLTDCSAQTDPDPVRVRINSGAEPSNRTRSPEFVSSTGCPIPVSPIFWARFRVN